MVSLPSATATIRSASATAAPPLLPPADLPGSNALRVTPKTSLKVCEPRPNSGVLVLPMTMQPAAFRRATIRPSTLGTLSRKRGEPIVVRSPAVAAMSLIAIGMPCSQPRLSPAASCASRASASRSKSASSRRLTMALCSGLTAAMRASVACISSRHDSRRAWMAALSSCAAESVMSLRMVLLSASRTSCDARAPSAPVRPPAAAPCPGRAPCPRQAASR